MTKDPAILFYSQDFLTGVADLTMQERGQYITLLCLQHAKGKLTQRMIQIAVPDVSEYVLIKFEQDEDGNYINQRLSDETEKRQSFIQKQKMNGKKGGRPKTQKNPNETQTKPKPNPDKTQSKPKRNPNPNPNKSLSSSSSSSSSSLSTSTKKKEEKSVTQGHSLSPKFEIPDQNEVVDLFMQKSGDKSYSSQKGEQFWLHYQNNGWKVGRNRMKDWRLAVAQWIARDKQSGDYPKAVEPKASHYETEQEFQKALKQFNQQNK